MDKFPKDFLWGAATSSHQVEGNNRYNDWWSWELQGKTKQASGLACNHYKLFEDDFELAKLLNHNCHRFSIEWSRIEPEEGSFNQEEIEHYRQVINALKQRGLEPIVTLHHFSNPIWFAKLVNAEKPYTYGHCEGAKRSERPKQSQKQDCFAPSPRFARDFAGLAMTGFSVETKPGGWLNKDAPRYFVRYAKKIIEEFGKDVKFWITINEPMVYVYQSYILGIWPPGEKSIFKAKKVASNLIKAHRLCYRMIKDIYRKNNWPEPKISIAKNMRLFFPCNPKSILDSIAAGLRNRYFNYQFINKIKDRLDFIGLNYYTIDFVRFKKLGAVDFFGDSCFCKRHRELDTNFLGSWIYPEGLFKILLKLKRYKLPILITENGVCTNDDSVREKFILEHLRELNKAIKQGVPVFGYLYWSLLDNFEWHQGFSPRFGLIDVDYQTQERKIRKSALVLAKICKDNKIE